MNSISAILNKHQAGELYFGIKPNGEVVGQIVTDQTLRDVSQKIGNLIEPRIFPEISRVVIDGKDCVYVKFEGNNTPYFAKGIAKIRVADEDLTMTPQELTSYIRDNASEGNQWENFTSNKLVDDADEELLRQYVERARAAGRISFEYTDKATVLRKLGLSEGDHLTNAGKVLFADDIVQDVQMAIFATNERVTFNDIQRVYGPIIRLVDFAEKYILNNIHWRVEFDGSIQRKEIPEIPADAVREALLNSFCHKDHGADKTPINADKTPINADIIKIIIDFIAQNGSITNVQAQKILGLKETITMSTAPYCAQTVSPWHYVSFLYVAAN